MEGEMSTTISLQKTADSENRRVSCTHVLKYIKTEKLRSEVERNFLGLAICVTYNAVHFKCVICGAEYIREDRDK